MIQHRSTGEMRTTVRCTVHRSKHSSLGASSTVFGSAFTAWFSRSVLGVLTLCILLSILAPTLVRAAESVDLEIQALRKEVRALNALVEEQAVLLQSIYDYLDNVGGLTAQREEWKKEKLLLMEVVATVSDKGLTSKGAANPAVPEFAAITTSGGVSVFDVTGKRTRTLMAPKQVVRAVAYSPDGLSLLAGTRSGSILVWDLRELGRVQP